LFVYNSYFPACIIFTVVYQSTRFSVFEPKTDGKL
jgi:hypothetical protein